MAQTQNRQADAKNKGLGRAAPERDHTRKRFEEAVNELHETFQRWDNLIPSERRILWKHEL